MVVEQLEQAKTLSFFNLPLTSSLLNDKYVCAAAALKHIALQIRARPISCTAGPITRLLQLILGLWRWRRRCLIRAHAGRNKDDRGTQGLLEREVTIFNVAAEERVILQIIRAIIEEDYAKRLAKLAKIALGRDEIGYVTTAYHLCSL